MKLRTWVALAALAGCQDSADRTEQFLADAAKIAEEKHRGEVPPLPALKPRVITPLVIERDPFKR